MRPAESDPTAPRVAVHGGRCADVQSEGQVGRTMPELHPSAQAAGARYALRLRHKRLQAQVSDLCNNGEYHTRNAHTRAARRAALGNHNGQSAARAKQRDLRPRLSRAGKKSARRGRRRTTRRSRRSEEQTKGALAISLGLIYSSWRLMIRLASPSSCSGDFKFNYAPN